MKLDDLLYYNYILHMYHFVSVKGMFVWMQLNVKKIQVNLESDNTGLVASSNQLIQAAEKAIAITLLINLG